MKPPSERTLDRIDIQCDSFESQWLAGDTPQIEQHLADSAGRERSILLRELVALEIDYRRKRGEQPRLDEYRARFPDDFDEITPLFRVAEDTDVVAADAETVTQASSAAFSDGDHPLGRFGDYELLAEIARGGMGVVYEARQISLDRIVAVKMILGGEFASEIDVQRFHAEAQAAAGLDHPHIVPVYEVGRHDGRHFFSMGYIAGESLQSRLKDEPLPPRTSAELLRTLADAVEYAHRQGVVHRDLKPGNVLLQIESSEPRIEGDDAGFRRGDPDSRPSTLNPRITDFGLAKRTHVDSEMTATGQVLGTPGYMPPEQAAGRLDEIDAKSDVYSLGAILYCALTGRPPFQASGLAETLKHVLEQEPVSPRQLNPSIDRDLETICLKCLEKSADNRYASAALLADDLGRYLHGKPIVARPVSGLQRAVRWCRRHPAVASLSGLVFLVTIAGITGVTWQWRSAEAARATAQENYEESAARGFKLAEQVKRTAEQKRRGDLNLAHAEDVVYRFYTDVAESGELAATPGTQLLRAQLLQRAQDYQEQFIRDNRDADLTASYAAAHWRLGAVQLALGQSEQAEANCRTAVELWRELQRRDPENTAHAYGLGNSLAMLGRALADRDKVDEALATYSQAMKVLEPIQKNTASGASRLTVASLLVNLGTAHTRAGRTDAAIDHYERAVAEWQDLAEGASADTFDLPLAKNSTNLGNLYSKVGRTADALRQHQRAVSLAQRLLERYPRVPEHSSTLVMATNNYALMHERAGRLNDAADALGEAVTLLRRLIRENPNVPDLRGQLIAVTINHGRVLRYAGKLDAALKTYDEAIPSAERLASDQPDRAEHRNDIARLLNHQGLVLEGLGRISDALDHYRRCNKLREELVSAHPGVELYREELVAGCINQGHLERVGGRLAAARTAFARGLSVADDLAARRPAVMKFQSLQASCYAGIGQIDAAENKFNEALARFEKSIEIGKRLSQSDPSNVDYRKRLGQRTLNLGTTLAKLRQLDRAKEQFQAGIDIWKGLLAIDAKVPMYRLELIKCHGSLATVAQLRRKYGEARGHVENAQTAAKSLVSDFPRNPQHRASLARLHGHQAALAKAARDNKASAAEYAREIGILEKLAKEYPQSLEFRDELADAWHNAGMLYLYSINRTDAAVNAFGRAVEIREMLLASRYRDTENRTNLGGARVNLAIVYAEAQRWDDAVASLEKAEAVLLPVVRDNPRHSKAIQYVNNCRSLTGKVLHHRAFFAAVDENATPASIQRAVKDATRACELTGYRHDLFLTTLGVACGRAGDFDAAVKHVQAAMKLAPQRDRRTRLAMLAAFARMRAWPERSRSVPIIAPRP